MKANFTVAAMIAVFFFGSFLACAEEGVPEGDHLKVMTFNIWGNGRAGKQPLSQTIKVIQASQADIVGLQEASAGTVKAIAGKLGWQHSGSILSSCEIVGRKRNGVRVRLKSGRQVFVFNEHFFHAPYQPYQLLGIPYGKGKFIKTEKEAIAEAKKARGHEVAALLKEINGIAEKEMPIFVTGDFNEPSHLDWTAKAANLGRHPIKVHYPVSRSFSEAGFIDAYRAVYPDEMKFPGYTWTPLTKSTNPKDHHDRIDFVMARGKGVEAEGVQVVGEHSEHADLVVSPYPSDHRAVVASFTITGRAKEDGRKLDKAQFEKATLVMRARVKSPGSGSKYLWSEVEPIEIFKGPKSFGFPDAFKVAALSVGENLPVGEATLYLVPYNPEKPEHGWRLLQKFDSKKQHHVGGFSHHHAVPKSK